MTGNCINLSPQRFTLLGKTLAGFILLLVSIGANAAVEQEIQFVFNTFSFLVWGALIMWMCAGFTMLEAGSVRTKNASVICLKNIGLYSIAGLMYYFVGYNLMVYGCVRVDRLFHLSLRPVGGRACFAVR